MNYTVNIDTIKLQIDFRYSDEQRDTMYHLARALETTFPFLIVKYNTNHKVNGALTHSVLTARTMVLEFTTGAYKDIYKETIYYITIELAGLKQYNKNDKIRYDCLIKLVEYFNTRIIRFEITGVDIAVDMECPFINTYAFCNMKSAGKKNYYKVNELQPYLTTLYIEKYNKTHHNVMKRAQIYDKPVKDEHITYPLTRFELKLQTPFFNRHQFESGLLQEQLDKYHILYFPTIQEKEVALSHYAQFEDTIRRRDLHKIGLDRYRLYPNTSELEEFLFNLYSVYESDLDLPVSEVNNGFDFN